MINIEAIATNITTEQLSKAHKIIDLQTSEDFYQVGSSDGTTDYEVHYDSEKGLTCTCEAGKHGFANCKNYCWHVRASVACRREELKAEKKARSIESQVPAWAMR
jgi:hypothetical protein